MDKDLESIKSGQGLSQSQTENDNSKNQSGTRLDQRGLTSEPKGIRYDQYTKNNNSNKNGS